jgi:cell division transport system permease protein
LTGLYGSTFKLEWPGLGDTMILLGFAAVLGWLGAWLSVSRHLWLIEPR